MKTRLLLFSAVCALFTISCEDDSTKTASSALADATVNAQIDQVTDDVTLIIEDQLRSFAAFGRNATVATVLPDCATVTTVISSGTWTRTIDFGAEGCELPNGNILSGSIVLSGSIDFDQPSYTGTYTFDNFHHNDRSVAGGSTFVRTFESTPLDAEVHPVVNADLNYTITYPNGDVYTRTGTRIGEQTEGYESGDTVPEDNVYLITGNWLTTFPSGNWTATITTPLRMELSCDYIVSGEVSFVQGEDTSSLNYGTGECDNIAILTENGLESTITLGN
ncbi:MAG TPA: hypothetical protein VF676_05500 [Flavobacterium sp.]|jgi:hypothetical protein